MSEYASNGSKLTLKVPVKSTGSCGIIVNFCLKSCKPIVFIFISSIIMSPSFISSILNKPSDNELLPAPVLPTIPI